MMSSTLVIDDYIFDFFYGIALSDATNRVSLSGDKKKLISNNNIRKEVKDYAEGIINGTTTDFISVVNKIKQLNEVAGEIRIDNLTFGKIQKLINMTMKYLYIKYYDNSAVAKNYKYCYAPMDRYMCAFVYDSYKLIKCEAPGFKRELAWSQIDRFDGDFKAFQDAICSIIKVKKLGVSRIGFDFMFWELARKVYDMECSVEEVWQFEYKQ